MEIDIISFTDTQFAALSEAQIMEVKSAQQKKNKLAEKMAETKRKEKARLVENGTFVSRLWDLFCLEQEEKFAVEVENIRDALLFYLRFSARPEEGTAAQTLFQGQIQPGRIILFYNDRIFLCSDFFQNHILTGIDIRQIIRSLHNRKRTNLCFSRY